MSSVEERLARDIAAVTGGVVVSESDLRDAHEAVVDRLDSRRQHDRRRTLAAVGAAAVVVPILGLAAFHSLGGEDTTAPPVSPAPSRNAADIFLAGSAPTPDLIRGVWRVDNGTMLLRFTADGEVRYDDGGRLFSDPDAVGTYEIAGDVITVTVDGGRAGCAGQTLAMRVSLPETGAMRFVHTSPGSAGCATAQDEFWVLEQVLPTNSDYLRRFDVPEKADWGPPAGPSSLYGDWMAEGGGHVLEFTGGGSYHVADVSGDTVDRGRWTFDESASRLHLVSAGDSPSCDQGDRLVLGGVEQTNPGTTIMRGAVEQDGCGGAWAPAVWVLIPH